MAIMWDQSLTPWIDPNGDPYAGARAFFFDANTSSPLTTYTEYSLSVPHDHPVVADAGGKFPPVFLPAQTLYRVRIEDSGGVTLLDIDGVSSPPVAIPPPPEGDTPIQFLHQTGDIKFAWRSSAPGGWVRMNGRTIGSSASSATERANDDCEALFIHLWNEDANLPVTGGRGATANGDWASAKTIVLPDARSRGFIGPDSFGNAAANRVTDAQLGQDSDTLGSAGGSASHTLTIGQLPAHSHTGTTSTNGEHTHTLPTANNIGGITAFSGQSPAADTFPTSAAGAHNHTFTTENTGSGEAHNNLQPSIVVPSFIKL